MKVIHLKLNLERFDVEESHRYYEQVVQMVGDEYTVFATPFDVTFERGDDFAISINNEDYTYEQLAEILEKAQRYDALCK